MAARAVSRSRSSSAASSASGSWPPEPGPTWSVGGAGRHVGQALAAARRGRARRRAAGPASRAPRGRPGPGRAARPRRARGRRAGGGWPPACRAAPRDPRRAACRAPWRAARRAGAAARRRRARPWWTSAATSVGPRSGVPGISSPRASSPASNFERRAGWSPHEIAQLLHDRLQRVEPVGVDLDLDPAQLHGALPVAHDDHGVVERDLGHVDAADPQREGAPAGAHLEHLVQAARADDGAQPAADRPVGAERVEPGRRQDLGDLQALAQAAALGGLAVLQRDLVVAAAAPGADDEAGAGDAPVVGVEIGVDQPPRRSGRARSPSRRRRSRWRGWAAWPATARPAAGRGRRTATRSRRGRARPARLPWTRTSRSGYCGRRISIARDGPRLPRFGRGRDGSLRAQWRDEQ